MCWLSSGTPRGAPPDPSSRGRCRGREQLGDLDLGDPSIVQRGEEIADVKNADDLVERVAEDGITRVRRAEDRGSASSGGISTERPDDVRPRDHHVRCLLVGGVEDLVEHLPFVVLDLTLLAGALEQHLQLGLRERLVRPPRGSRPSPLLADLARSLQHPDHRLEEDKETANGGGHRQRDPVGVPSASPFGTSSPTTTCIKVITNAIVAATSAASQSSSRCGEHGARRGRRYQAR